MHKIEERGEVREADDDEVEPVPGVPQVGEGCHDEPPRGHPVETLRGVDGSKHLPATNDKNVFKGAQLIVTFVFIG